MIFSEHKRVCVGQSLLTSNPFGNPSPVPPSSQTCEVSTDLLHEMSKLVPKLVAYLIDHCPDLFGDQTLRLLGAPAAQLIHHDDLHLSSSSRQDSGAEESDSLNSLPDSNGAHSTGSGTDDSAGSRSSSNGNHRCDDSSIDSLERALMDDTSRVSPGVSLEGRPVNALANKMSLSNLSHDSGLTLSDTQLYTPDEDEGADDLDQFPGTGGQTYGRKTSSPLAYPPYMAKCDDSSIDSLERALMDDTSRVSPGVSLEGRPVNALANKMSLSNLSHDSGLTLSDTQLYTPDEDEGADDLDQFPGTGGQTYGRKTSSPLAYPPYMAKSSPHLDQTGLDGTDLNVTFSYGRSVGVSIDGSCHDVVMRKRRHLQGLHHTNSNDLSHYISRNSRTGAANGQTPAQTYHNHNTNANNYRNNNHHIYYRQSQPPALNGHHYQHNGNGYHHHNQYNHQHIPIQYSKSYSYLPTNGTEDLTDEHPMLNTGADCQREYRYRRPPLAAVLGGAPASTSHTYHRQTSVPHLRRSSSEESLVRTSYDAVDGEMPSNGYSLANSLSLQYSTPVQNDWRQQPDKYYNNQYVSNNRNATQVTLRADVHHYPNSTGSANTGAARIARQESNTSGNGQKPVDNRVASICSSGSSETASQRSSLSSGKQSTSSSLRNGSGMSCPPSYHEAMTRKEMLCRAQSSGALNTTGLSVRKGSSASTTSSTHSSHIYEESVRVYNSDNKRNVTHRAVPVRVAPVDNGRAVDSDLMQRQMAAQASQAHRHVHRELSEPALQPAHNTGSRIVRISAQQNHNNVYHSPLQACQSSNVSVLQRSAKDFTPEEWRKDIHSNVATLRKLFTTSQSTSGQPMDGNTRNIYVRQTVRPVSVLIETTPKRNQVLKQRPNSTYANLKDSCVSQAPKGVTVVHVGQTTGAGEGHIITGVGHKRADSVGNSSSEEESYV
ncbi:unnamed protein product [Oppiella nova]|uniref:Uncharacterized protein n=1 Tax=Oppiella nova TaxID=334625 RepID=A0A7R9QJ11_9ACAR|nr:unnamed protein product [Oppiella nova]CAG2166706.1 unnamed protein product [Oppiella nova]